MPWEQWPRRNVIESRSGENGGGVGATTISYDDEYQLEIRTWLVTTRPSLVLNFSLPLQEILDASTNLLYPTVDCSQRMLMAI